MALTPFRFLAVIPAYRGFAGDTVIAQALDAKGGYSFVLAGLKAWLEHGIQLNLVRNHFPEGCPE